MASALDSLVGVLPVIVVTGVATKITESMFQKQQSPKPRKKKRSKRGSSVGFGNFSNVGF